MLDHGRVAGVLWARIGLILLYHGARRLARLGEPNRWTRAQFIRKPLGDRMGALLILVVLGLVLILWMNSRGKGRHASNRERQDVLSPVDPLVTREGAVDPAHEAFMVSYSGDFQRMEAAVALPTNPTDRHFLLLQLCSEAYRGRKDPRIRTRFLMYARMHIAEFPSLAPTLKRDLLLDSLPSVPTFQMLATVLTEDGAFEEAIQVCNQAKELGLNDGTKLGYGGRIERIRKKMARLKS